jgi:mRNA-degrading endonuclease YafQ of YafQ-DinJ toxin-antitoxin module
MLSEAQKGKVMSPPPPLLTNECSRLVSLTTKPSVHRKVNRQGEIKAKISNTKGTSIYVYSKDHKLESSFSSARECAKFFNVSKDTILRYAVNEKLFKEKWILSVKEVSN